MGRPTGVLTASSPYASAAPDCVAGKGRGALSELVFFLSFFRTLSL